jgi:outer membrane receptor protein involved in Fe transport
MVLRFSAATLVLAILTVATSEAWAVDLTQQIDFKIPPQRLSTALLEFSHQAKVQIVVGPEVGERRTDGVTGTHSIGEALSTLLGGSSLRYRVINDTSITVGSASALDKQPAATPPAGAANSSGAANRELSAQTDPAGTSPDNAPSTQNQNLPDSRSEPPPREGLSEIIVTGTHIRGGVSPASPLIEIDKEEIQRTGYGSIRELISSLPQNYGGGAQENTGISPNPQAGQNVGATTTVDLRGLGAGSTLTLLNGHRLAPNGQGYATDISAIPLSAIKRIEILPDGASAVYGSDAVGGVVNILLDDEFEGAETTAQYGHVTRGSMSEARIAQTFGTSWNSGHALFTYEYYERSPLLAGARSYASAAPPSFYLTADQHRNSAVLHVEQHLGDLTTAFADVLFANQTKVENTINDSQTHDSLRSTTVSAGVSRSLPGAWAVELSGLFSRQTDDQLALPLPPQTPTESDYKNDLSEVDLKADGPIAQLPAGPLKAAVGLSNRRERLSTVNAQTGYASRHIVSGFAELSVPIVGQANALPGLKSLELSAAVRTEKYNDFGSSTNPKLGLTWVPVENLKIRGTWGTSFKAPSLNDKYGAIDAAIFDLPDVGGTLTRSLIALGANRDLGPEKAHTWTVGANYHVAFSSNLDAATSLTYFNTVYRDRIQFVDNNIFNILPNAAIYPSAVVRNPSLAFVTDFIANAAQVIDAVGPYDPSEIAAFVRATPLNVASYKTDGLDFLVHLKEPSRVGEFAESLNATYYLNASQRTTAYVPTVSRLNDIFYLPGLKLRASASWSKNSWSIGSFVNFQKRYHNDNVVPTEPVDSYTTVDMQVSFAPDTLFGGGFRVGLSALNVFDRQPPRVVTPLFPQGVQFGFDPANANPIDRFLSLQLSKHW